MKLSLFTEIMAKKKKFRNESRGQKNIAFPETVKHILLTQKGMHIKKEAVDKEWTWNLSWVLFLAALVLDRTMQCPGLHVP